MIFGHCMISVQFVYTHLPQLALWRLGCCLGLGASKSYALILPFQSWARGYTFASSKTGDILSVSGLMSSLVVWHVLHLGKHLCRRPVHFLKWYSPPSRNHNSGAKLVKGCAV